MDSKEDCLVLAERIERSILLVRNHKVMLDRDLAALYGVATRTLIQAVKRNGERFPEDFSFQLTWDEARLLRSQIVILNASASTRGRHSKYRPFAFTEHGILMLSSVLRSPRAIQVNIATMRAFVRLRQMLSTHEVLARKLADLEKRYDAQFKVVFVAFRQLMAPEPRSRRRIGFRSRD
jgi:hypothetical protein